MAEFGIMFGEKKKPKKKMGMGMGGGKMSPEMDGDAMELVGDLFDAYETRDLEGGAKALRAFVNTVMSEEEEAPEEEDAEESEELDEDAEDY